MLRRFCPGRILQPSACRGNGVEMFALEAVGNSRSQSGTCGRALGFPPLIRRHRCRKNLTRPRSRNELAFSHSRRCSYRHLSSRSRVASCDLTRVQQGVTARGETEFSWHEHSDGQRIVPTSLLRYQRIALRVLPHAGRTCDPVRQSCGTSRSVRVTWRIRCDGSLLPFWVPSQVVSHEGRFLRNGEAPSAFGKNVIDFV